MAFDPQSGDELGFLGNIIKQVIPKSHSYVVNLKIPIDMFWIYFLQLITSSWQTFSGGENQLLGSMHNEPMKEEG